MVRSSDGHLQCLIIKCSKVRCCCFLNKVHQISHKRKNSRLSPLIKVFIFFKLYECNKSMHMLIVHIKLIELLNFAHN